MKSFLEKNKMVKSSTKRNDMLYEIIYFEVDGIVFNIKNYWHTGMPVLLEVDGVVITNNNCLDMILSCFGKEDFEQLCRETYNIFLLERL